MLQKYTMKNINKFHPHECSCVTELLQSMLNHGKHAKSWKLLYLSTQSYALELSQIELTAPMNLLETTI